MHFGSYQPQQKKCQIVLVNLVGVKWINALSKIDYDKRLYRGYLYAMDAAVRNVSINANVVTATVKGSGSQQ